MANQKSGQEYGTVLVVLVPGEKELRALLGGLLALPAFIYREKIEEVSDIVLMEKQQLGQIEIWSSGRAFNSDLDLSWEKTGRGYAVRVLCEDVKKIPQPVLSEGRLLDDRLETEQGKVLLWGIKRPGTEAWIETRIPRPLQYPVGGGSQVEIQGLWYKKNGMVRYFRMKEVAPSAR